jgi:hypothetical protein
LIRREWLAAGTHVTSVGLNPGGREVDAQTVADALVVVESRAAALAPFPAGANDLEWSIRDGLISAGQVVEIGELVNGTRAGRTSDAQITLYKSVGVAVQDAAAAALVLEAARKTGTGVEVESESDRDRDHDCDHDHDCDRDHDCDHDHDHDCEHDHDCDRDFDCDSDFDRAILPAWQIAQEVAVSSTSISPAAVPSRCDPSRGCARSRASDWKETVTRRGLVSTPTSRPAPAAH